MWQNAGIAWNSQIWIAEKNTLYRYREFWNWPPRKLPTFFLMFLFVVNMCMLVLYNMWPFLSGLKYFKKAECWPSSLQYFYKSWACSMAPTANTCGFPTCIKKIGVSRFSALRRIRYSQRKSLTWLGCIPDPPIFTQIPNNLFHQNPKKWPGSIPSKQSSVHFVRLVPEIRLASLFRIPSKKVNSSQYIPIPFCQVLLVRFLGSGEMALFFFSKMDNVLWPQICLSQRMRKWVHIIICVSCFPPFRFTIC